jgi:hypothetical protein
MTPLFVLATKENHKNLMIEFLWHPSRIRNDVVIFFVISMKWAIPQIIWRKIVEYFNFCILLCKKKKIKVGSSMNW